MNGADITPNILILTLPLLIIEMALLGLGVGLLVSAVTTKYRDLKFALNFGIQGWMFLTPIVYPLSEIPEHWRNVFMLNPMASVVEVFRKAFLGTSIIEPIHIVIGVSVTMFFLVTGVLLFSKTEKTFMDTI